MLIMNQLSDRELLLQQLKNNLYKVQQRMKLQADKKRHDMELMVGDFWWL